MPPIVATTHPFTRPLRLRTGQPSFEALRGLIARHFAGETRQRLDALVGLLTPRNLSDAYGRISTDNRKLDDLLVKDFQLQMYACQEDMDINWRCRPPWLPLGGPKPAGCSTPPYLSLITSNP